jgi:hypothetical protein
MQRERKRVEAEVEGVTGSSGRYGESGECPGRHGIILQSMSAVLIIKGAS